eukprot:CAMPEP_0202894052 /NCGR_PEP_ID=MMETSP1392-20130828/3512_1 /ASSEMBLY_ACC=CAM_ASM_000868 /TAXON_ID=225041 /ORGANISM="Chlamydomonas chlamydogama, Strain SAG 11-48b" /LENGTH=74 /DNA_ID=CAMNT_0049578603 /DNA_START=518 /DNA_END=742 /DNA_ORIENTATION=-
MRDAIWVASAASPSMIGTMGCQPGRMLKPAAVILSLKYTVLAASLSLSSVLPLSRSNMAMEAPATAGASVFENR